MFQKSFLYALCAVFIVLGVPSEAKSSNHALALYGTPKYNRNFKHLEYVNPEAPKGGEIRLHSLGTFDTLNPFTLKGIPASGTGLVFETLMYKSSDEPFSTYGWIAESVTIPKDKSSISYKIRKEARFHDGSKITPEDVIFSFETLKQQGHPLYRSYYKDVVKAEKTAPDTVKFSFKDGTNTELAMIMGELPVLSKKSWENRDFTATTLEPLMGSGLYKIDTFTQGRTISYSRVKDWWATNLPINKGRYNFDKITYDYYRDATVATEAFLAGRYDYRFENIAKNWALSYNTPAVKRGDIKRDEVKNELPVGMQAFVFNIRKPIFQDIRVRQALIYAFDFEWGNKNLAYGAYTRTKSYFENSELASRGLPSGKELEILKKYAKKYKGKIDDKIFTEEFKVPETDGSGNNRENLVKAAALLKEAGWELKNGVLRNSKGEAFTFEILENQNIFERWIQPYLRNLEKLGIKARYRVVDTAQYQHLTDNFDYDMIVNVFGQSISPGNEQRDYWSSQKADIKGSRNLIGIKNPIVDDLVEDIIQAPTREDLIAVTRALDRILLWNYYVIPHWYTGKYKIAYWDKFGQPEVKPKYDLSVIDTWWRK
ncbi:MAG: extracellular solute-binding protein [Alphaproteobacteria bacterium]|nr:extracellular solute-binding protein [Alphaproteobacteria bacterium]MCL2504880.1 extracellular solute-binding protein [Alphaproteobacteria bacterium]